MTYGDDNVMGISPEVPTFNHTVIRDSLVKIGVVYTMADKETESIPRIHISKISFLKRYWRWDAEIGEHMAQLEEGSIGKSLTKCVPSKTISLKAQAVDTMHSAIREYFFHGRDVFEVKRKLFLEIIDECELNDYLELQFPSYDSLLVEYRKNSQEFEGKSWR